MEKRRQNERRRKDTASEKIEGKKKKREKMDLTIGHRLKTRRRDCGGGAD